MQHTAAWRLLYGASVFIPVQWSARSVWCMWQHLAGLGKSYLTYEDCCQLLLKMRLHLRCRCFISSRLVHCCAGASLHVCMTPHGPDTATFESGTTKDSHKPERLPADTLAFMFEVSSSHCFLFVVTDCLWSKIRFLRDEAMTTEIVLLMLLLTGS